MQAGCETGLHCLYNVLVSSKIYVGDFQVISEGDFMTHPPRLLLEHGQVVRHHKRGASYEDKVIGSGEA